MKIFLSWSGKGSREVAEYLREWLPEVLQPLDPWVSSMDIDAGTRWAEELAEELETCEAGILCLTPQNLGSAWVLFEAGALSHSFRDGIVIPYLIGMEPSELGGGPLSQFQSVKADRDGTRKMLWSLNDALGERRINPSVLGKSFKRHWEALETAVLPAVESAVFVQRMLSAQETETMRLLKEILQPTLTKFDNTLHDLATIDYDKIKTLLDNDDEKNYLRDAERYGIGYSRVEIICNIASDGSATISRSITVEAYSNLSELDYFLMIPEDIRKESDRTFDQNPPRSVNDDRDIFVKEVKTEFGRTSALLEIFPQMSVGDELVFVTDERASPDTFAINKTRAELANRRSDSDYFAWSVNRPTRHLILRVRFPQNQTPQSHRVEVKIAATTGIPSERLQERETERVNAHRSKRQPAALRNKKELTLHVDYPMTGLVYQFRWKPKPK